MICAVLLAGGIGTRIGSNLPKQFIEINNKPILVYCIEKFVKVKEFDKIIVSSPKKYIEHTEKLIKDFFSDKRLVVIEGGETRQETLLNSLHYIQQINGSEEVIVVNHDAARIFVSQDQIKKCIIYTKKFGSSSPIIPSTDVIIEVDDEFVKTMPNRYDIVHVQTPQGFKLNEYLDLFNNIPQKEIENIHEIVKVYYLNKKFIKLYDGEKSNFKITNPIDIKIAESILKEIN